MTTVAVNVSVDVSDEEILDMIDTAGYGIGYWAERAVVDEVKRQYTVTPDEEARQTQVMRRDFVINFDDIVKVLVEFATGSHELGYPREYAQKWLAEKLATGEDSGDLDSTIMDCVIQQCAFGEIIFG
jgi:hypothetical protein